MVHAPSTSITNPLRIAEVAVGSRGGRIGITFAPGKCQPNALSGNHARDLDLDLDAVAVWNAAAVVTLCEPHELETLRISRLGQETRRRHMEWHHWPIRDHNVPDVEFEAAWPMRSYALRSLLACGGRVLIHCKGGLGRAGMISARLLVETGVRPGEAIRAVRAVRPGAIQSMAHERWVAAGTEAEPARRSSDPDAMRDRAIGALLGLAVGDAVGAAIEFSPKPRHAVLDGMVGGGPHQLQPGEWTDDTAMALALADSLLADPSLDPHDLMRRFVDWHESGAYSCTGTCFDIGNATRAALDRYRQSGDPFAGSIDPGTSGNGALMRLAPVAIRHWQDRGSLLRVADAQTRTTHGAPATMTASRLLAEMLADVITGHSFIDVFSSPAAEAIEGGWRGLHRDAVNGTGYVVRTLQAAVWAVSRTTSFRSAVLLAANLGDDADTTAAVAGQLAGALYGLPGIPQEWLRTLAWRERLEGTAGCLFDAGTAASDHVERNDEDPEDEITIGSAFAAPWMTADWTLRQRLQALARFRPIFDRDGFVFAEEIPAQDNGGIITMGWTSLGDEAQEFYKVVYDYGWVRAFNWSDWGQSLDGERLLKEPEALARANEDDLAKVITVCVRADRFAEGYLKHCYEEGLIGRVVERADELLGILKARFGAEVAA